MLDSATSTFHEKKCKKRDRLDIHGLCIRALELPLSLRKPLAHLIGDILGSDLHMAKIRMEGSIKAKRKGTVSTNDTRGLLPQPCVIELASRVILARLSPTLQTWSDSNCLSAVILGVGKGGQTRDVNFAFSQCLEKGRDTFGACAVALGDIAKCHDSLPWGACLQSFLRRGIQKA